MKQILFILLSIFSISAFANYCEEIAKYEKYSSSIFIVCPSLPTMTDQELGNLIYAIFTKNKFPPDEYTIDFVTTDNALSHDKLTKENHVGFYYTHDNAIIIWPKNKTKMRHVQLRT